MLAFAIGDCLLRHRPPRFDHLPKKKQKKKQCGSSRVLASDIESCRDINHLSECAGHTIRCDAISTHTHTNRWYNISTHRPTTDTMCPFKCQKLFVFRFRVVAHQTFF